MITLKPFACAPLILAALVMAAPQQADQARPGHSITPQITWAGSYSAKSDRAFLRITNEKDWAALWLEHAGDNIERDSYKEAVLPMIDFNSCIVVAMFEGKVHNTRSERLDSAEEFEDHWRVRIDPNRYQTMSMDGDGGAERVTPYGIWVFPRNAKKLIIEVDTNSLIGHPPVWTQKAQFDPLK